jgi:phage shock protein PspC (stress-responsive transcriptional regulator)
MKALYRSRTDRVFAGVLGGFAEFFGIPSILLRILVVVLVLIANYFVGFFGFFMFTLVYTIGILSIPINKDFYTKNEKHDVKSFSRDDEIQGKAREISSDDPS